ncbi:MAG TPA: hypothetical protein VLJ42_02110 [Solirubrobacteraceae bacterium]|nr:hypothetical protein [Solirubrobacteraceae bacterium]
MLPSRPSRLLAKPLRLPAEPSRLLAKPLRLPAEPPRLPAERSRLPAKRLLLRSGCALTVAAILAGAGGASASPPSDIDGVWSFGGGKVAVHQQPGGAYQGTVVAATQFATCSHPVGEEMWSNIHQQSDGSYHGFHQWFVGGAKCDVSPTRGLTAWRVLQKPDGSHFLRVCFSSPGSNEQPLIAANGTSTHVDYDCSDSSLIAPLPVPDPTGGQDPSPGNGSPSGQGGSPTSPTSSGARGEVESFGRSVLLPSARKCLSRRAFKINLRNPTNDPLKLVVVTIKGHRIGIARTARAITAGISLKNLPRGTYTVKITATTVLGHHLIGSRTYHTCVAKRKHTKPAKLRRS